VTAATVAALGATLLVAALAAGLAGCAGEPRRAAPATYVVRGGDTLYSIAWRHALDFRDLARWNGIAADYRIAVGQVLRLAPRDASAPAGAAGGARPAPAALPAAPPPHWLWPADGAVAGSVRQPQGGVGLAIAGVAGQEVRAAAAGRVVYTGAGLRAYGQLVIIKHDEAWISAYGYNREVSVAEGETVHAGQRIAAMGLGPGQQPQLYFEIRLNGRPVDPAGQLPPRD